MLFKKFKSVEDTIVDGDHFLVAYPNGLVILCAWYKSQWEFSPVEDYSCIYKDGWGETSLTRLTPTADTLIMRVEVEG